MSLSEQPTITEESFARHLTEFEGNPWLAELKRKHWQDYLTLPMPTRRDESWRFSSLKRVNIEAFTPAAEPAQSAIDLAIERSEKVSASAARLVFVDDRLVLTDALDEAFLQQKILFAPLGTALAEHRDLLEGRFLSEANKLGGAKLAALHNAFLRNGSVLIVPDNVELAAPVEVFFWSSQPRTAIFPHSLVMVGANAKANLVDHYGSLHDEPFLLGAMGSIQAGQGSHVHRKVVQNVNAKATCFQLESNVAERDSSVMNIAVNIGGHYARMENHTRITGPGADVKMYSLTVATGEQEFDQRTLQIHEAPHATSDLLYKNALLDRSKTIFSGLIRVEEDAQETDAYQTNRNLLLDPNADANSLPGLEIEANDVRCSHGATTGQIDDSELFYMRTRGLTKEVAHELLVFGFFEEILEKFPTEELRDNIRVLVQNKFRQKDQALTHG